jgi:hypothetical protein
LWLSFQLGRRKHFPDGVVSIALAKSISQTGSASWFVNPRRALKLLKSVIAVMDSKYFPGSCRG